MSGNTPAIVQGDFEHRWQATIRQQRPLILPRRHYVYPREAEEVERGALEVMIQPEQSEPFLATCALGFADPLAPTGVWSCPNPVELCAIAGGYAYLIDTLQPERFIQVAYRPVLAVHTVATPEVRLLLFVGNQAICAYGVDGLRWESPRLSDEGVAVHSMAEGVVHGAGWKLRTDCETPFTLDLRTGRFMGAEDDPPEHHASSFTSSPPDRSSF